MSQIQTVIIADDHALIRRGLASLLTQVLPDVAVLQAGTGEEVVELMARTPPGLLVLDYYLPGCDGVAFIRRLQDRFPSTVIVVLSAEERPTIIRDVLATGIRGFIPKSTDDAVTRKALELIIAGDTYVPTQALGIDGTPPDDVRAPIDAVVRALTETQQRILGHLINGASNKQIAQRSGLAVQTVKNQVSRIMRALGASNRAQAALKISRLDQNALAVLSRAAALPPRMGLEGDDLPLAAGSDSDRQLRSDGGQSALGGSEGGVIGGDDTGDDTGDGVRPPAGADGLGRRDGSAPPGQDKP